MDKVTLSNEEKGMKAVEALRQNRFKAEFYSTSKEVLEAILPLIPQHATVGIAGSWTLQQLGIVEVLEGRGNKIFCHNKSGLYADEVLEMRRKQLTCDVFLTSTNAITEDGRLVNTDATGNRVAAMTFGPKKVIVVAGINKIVKDLNEAEHRIHSIASPLNNKRLNKPNPCATTGHCADCKGPTRLCNVTSVIHKCPPATNINLFLVGEELGY
jgi:LUD domain